MVPSDIVLLWERTAKPLLFSVPTLLTLGMAVCQPTSGEVEEDDDEESVVHLL